MPETMYPCRTCGVGVADPAVTVATRARVTEGGAYFPGRELRLGECDACAELAAAAAQLVEQHPWLTSTFGPAGAPRIAAHAVWAADILGVADPLELLHTIRAERPMLAFEDHINLPDFDLSPRPGRWQHVSEAARHILQAGRARLAALRLAESQPPRIVPVPATAPTPAGVSNPIPCTLGCLFCGVADVAIPLVEIVRAGVAPRVWFPSHLGRFTGHLCRTCHEAQTAYGASGMGAVEAAAASWALGRNASAGADQVKPHCHTAATTPNSTPWEHLGPDARETLRKAYQLGEVQVL